VARVSLGLVARSAWGRNPSVAVRAALGFMQFRLLFACYIVAQRRGVVNGTEGIWVRFEILCFGLVEGL
jgi:hypothetical protein